MNIDTLEIEETPAQALTRRQLRTWAADCTSEPRSPVDGLTDCERRIIAELRESGYALTGRKFRRQIVARDPFEELMRSGWFDEQGRR